MLFFEANVDIRAGDRVILKVTLNGVVSDDIKLTVTPSLSVYDGVALHHREVYVSIEES
jgi:hypothetical protein